MREATSIPLFCTVAPCDPARKASPEAQYFIKFRKRNSFLATIQITSQIEDQVSFGEKHTAGIFSSIAIPSTMGIAVVDNGALPTPLATFGGARRVKASLSRTNARCGNAWNSLHERGSNRSPYIKIVGC
jgi:hypothetical protein